MIRFATVRAALLGRRFSGGLRVVVVLMAVAAIIPAAAVIGSFAIITPYDRYIVESPSSVSMNGDAPRIGIVLGSGVTRDGKPYRELRGRLDVAAEALQSGAVDKLILSGDNRFEHYNEPKAMRDYLISEHGIGPDRLQEDFAGRSTYESCERAAKVFGLESAVIISAQSHLPRAIYLCRHFGIDSYGIASHVEANNAARREAVARVKALLNAHVRGEPTILGAPIQL